MTLDSDVVPGVDAAGLTDVAAFARSVNASVKESDRLQRGVELIVELVAGCDHAGVSILTRAGVETGAATSDLVWRADSLQYELAEGPCLDSIRNQQTVLAHNVQADRRWPRWGPAVAQQMGVGAMLSFLLYDNDESYGALNMYANCINAYDGDDLALAQALAAHLGVAIAASREIQHRGTAMVSRTVIGQAEGILMERYGIDPDHAFAVLRRLSQDTNRKLIAPATELVTTGELTGLPPRSSRSHTTGRA